MAEDVRDLIDKIQEEGIRAAQKKALEIETLARQQADDIIATARRDADAVLAAALERIRREEERSQALLSQAGRDLLLMLRNEIHAMLGRIIVSDVREVLTPELLSGLIASVITKFEGGDDGSVEITLKPEDLEMLEKHYYSRISEATKKTIVLRPSGEITGGFIISFDNGRSCYDFSDASLAEYIGTQLKPKLNRILNDAVKE